MVFKKILFLYALKTLYWTPEQCTEASNISLILTLWLILILFFCTAHYCWDAACINILRLVLQEIRFRKHNQSLLLNGLPHLKNNWNKIIICIFSNFAKWWIFLLSVTSLEIHFIKIFETTYKLIVMLSDHKSLE